MESKSTAPEESTSRAEPGRQLKTVAAIDMNKTNAQQARRVLDRLVGYKISPILWEKVQRGLSAGRVQSVAVRLVCEREEEIKAFVPEEYWSVDVTCRADQPPPFEARIWKWKGESGGTLMGGPGVACSVACHGALP